MLTEDVNENVFSSVTHKQSHTLHKQTPVMDAFLGKVESVDVFPEFCEIFCSNYSMELIKMAASSKQTKFLFGLSQNQAT